MNEEGVINRPFEDGQLIRVLPSSLLGCGLSGQYSLATVIETFTYRGDTLLRLELIRIRGGREGERAVAKPCEVERVNAALKAEKSEDELFATVVDEMAPLEARQ